MELSGISGIGYIHELCQAQYSGQPIGIFSVCSSNEHVLRSAFQLASQTGTYLLIESTCNQVNQFGGYSGMTPSTFSGYLRVLAGEYNVSTDRLIIGGDHIGPYPWRNEPVSLAMEKAISLVRECAKAGYRKLHLDASMKLGDDGHDVLLDLELASSRAAHLCAASEETFTNSTSQDSYPVYVIGTEVPLPGGAGNDRGLSVTQSDHVSQMITSMKDAFWNHNLEAVWERVIAVVVQPGVEFGNDYVVPYDTEKAKSLSDLIIDFAPMVYEVHSTDYQLQRALNTMVEDHFAILKVGPALTFAFREALFDLAMMEDEIFGKGSSDRSDLIGALEKEMLALPGYWKPYYSGTELQMNLLRKYSYSDRARYYWHRPRLHAAIEKLINNMRQNEIPDSLLSQFMPEQYERIRHGILIKEPESLVADKIKSVLKDYMEASRMDQVANE